MLISLKYNLFLSCFKWKKISIGGKQQSLTHWSWFCSLFSELILPSNKLSLVFLRKKTQCDYIMQIIRVKYENKNAFNASHILGVIMLFYNALLKTRWVQKDFHVKWYSWPLTVTRRMSLVVLKLLTLLGHLSSPQY